MTAFIKSLLKMLNRSLNHRPLLYHWRHFFMLKSINIITQLQIHLNHNKICHNLFYFINLENIKNFPIFRSPSSILVCSGCYNLNATNVVAYKQQEFNSHRSEGWEIQDQGFGRFCVWGDPPSKLQTPNFSLSSHGGRGEGAHSGLFYIWEY